MDNMKVHTGRPANRRVTLLIAIHNVAWPLTTKFEASSKAKNSAWLRCSVVASLRRLMRSRTGCNKCSITRGWEPIESYEILSYHKLGIRFIQN